MQVHLLPSFVLQFDFGTYLPASNLHPFVYTRVSSSPLTELNFKTDLPFKELLVREELFITLFPDTLTIAIPKTNTIKQININLFFILSKLFKGRKEFGGITVLGDGWSVLIIDVQNLT